MTKNLIDFVVLGENDTLSHLNPRAILRAVKRLRDDFEDQGFKTDIESVLLLGELLDKVEDAALVSILERS